MWDVRFRWLALGFAFAAGRRHARVRLAAALTMTLDIQQLFGRFSLSIPPFSHSRLNAILLQQPPRTKGAASQNPGNRVRGAHLSLSSSKRDQLTTISDVPSEPANHRNLVKYSPSAHKPCGPDISSPGVPRGLKARLACRSSTKTQRALEK